MPVALTASKITNDKAAISWSAVANAGLYHLQYKTYTSQTWITVTTDQTSYKLTGLSPALFTITVLKRYANLDCQDIPTQNNLQR
jgi:hypothetical protein